MGGILSRKKRKKKSRVLEVFRLSNSENNDDDDYSTLPVLDDTARGIPSNFETGYLKPSRNQLSWDSKLDTPYEARDHLTEQTRTPEHRYEGMIDHCKPMIIKYVIARQILPHMHTFLSEGDKDEVINEKYYQHSVECLIEKLKASQEPGKWQRFVEALETCKYKIVVDAIRRNGTKNNEKEETILQMLIPELREMLKPVDIIAELLKEDIISSDDKCEVMQKETMNGSIEAMDLLLDRIRRKHPNWFDKFVQALQSIGRSDLADKLLFKTEESKQARGPKGVVGSEDKTQEKILHSKEGYYFDNDLATITSNQNNEYENGAGLEMPYEAFDNNTACEDEALMEPINKLQENNKKLSTEGSQLDLEMAVYEKILTNLDSNNEKLRRKKSIVRKIKAKEDENQTLEKDISGIKCENVYDNSQAKMHSSASESENNRRQSKSYSYIGVGDMSNARSDAKRVQTSKSEADLMENDDVGYETVPEPVVVYNV